MAFPSIKFFNQIIHQFCLCQNNGDEEQRKIEQCQIKLKMRELVDKTFTSYNPFQCYCFCTMSCIDSLSKLKCNMYRKGRLKIYILILSVMGSLYTI